MFRVKSKENKVRVQKRLYTTFQSISFFLFNKSAKISKNMFLLRHYGVLIVD